MLAALGYFGIASRIDWWLFHLHAHRSTRDAALVAAQAHASGLAVERLGLLRYGSDTWPLQALHRPAAPADASLCIFAGVHGNEAAGVHAALALARDLGRDPTLYPGVNVWIVPLVNPAGWTHDLRHNGDNQDIARSFQHRPTQETTLLQALLAWTHCRTVVDLHEDRLRRAAYVLSYGDATALTAARELAQHIASAGHAVDRQSVGTGAYHTAPADYASVRRTTLALYAQQHGAAQSFTVETPARADLDARIAMHRLVLDALAQRMRTPP